MKKPYENMRFGSFREAQDYRWDTNHISALGLTIATMLPFLVIILSLIDPANANWLITVPLCVAMVVVGLIINYPNYRASVEADYYLSLR